MQCCAFFFIGTINLITRNHFFRIAFWGHSVNFYSNNAIQSWNNFTLLQNASAVLIYNLNKDTCSTRYTYDGFANLILFRITLELKNLSNWAICVNAYLNWESIALSHILSSVNSFESTYYLERGVSKEQVPAISVFLVFKIPVFFQIY